MILCRIPEIEVCMFLDLLRIFIIFNKNNYPQALAISKIFLTFVHSKLAEILRQFICYIH